ncbi:hypothetical protein QYR09_08575 [Cellulophaga lytica]|nr:hypothetical protein QYR09_08575 [Cellulophaga lytica]
MKKYVGLSCLLLLVGCSNYGQLKVVANMPEEFKEVSGLVSTGQNSLWLVEDKGNKDELYNVDEKGNWQKTLKVKNGKNHDWEDLTKDDNGNVYIGDFGNNASDRDNLEILKVPNPDNEKGDDIEAEKIEFSYPEQTDFSPKKKELLYDAESLFYWNNSLFIITKNRATPFNGEAFIYKIPATKGKYKAELVGSFMAGTDERTSRITSAAISPDKKTIVLISNGMLWSFTNFTTDNFTKGTVKAVDLGVRTQLESVCFITNNTLYLADEYHKKTGGNLYVYTLN